ncbi:ATP-binding protein [Bifidobacterium simiiventris]|uniref:ATP-binding protein n=1 Tax=Bifidobacterium simiiventris TaxID=2834434 RepID=UPI001C581EA6|nr:ATP-binding protein [Bifidobacterium simiiventris]MBW3078662.1 PspC domain-containing protein [Bifidobacterium simiiventris]
MRPKRGRMLCGVCRGVALHLGVSVWLVRLVFLISTCFFGAGAAAYLFLWLFVPVGDPVIAAAARARSVAQAPLSRGNAVSGPTGFTGSFTDGFTGSFTNGTTADSDDSTAGRMPNKPYRSSSQAAGTAAESGAAAAYGTSESLAEALRRAPKPALVALVGMASIAVAVLLSLGGVESGLILPILLALAGIGVAWLQYNASSGQLWSMLGSVALLFVAYAVFVMNAAIPGWGASPRRIILAGFLLLVAVCFAIVPWISSLIRELGTERALKEREEERADMTAHLHDGVLQTLALIQLHSEESATVFTLARQQERELREWLYQERTTTDRSVSAGIKDIAAHVEDEYGKPIEVVTVGDAQPSAQTDALLDAATQALVNAVTHGGEPVSVYCEAGASQVEVFVRDHGDGFDVNAIPEGRLGIRESIIGRIRRRGGTVEIVSRPGWGTEVRMHMPIAAARPGGSSGNGAPAGAGAGNAA